MRELRRRRQRGVTLIALLAILVLGTSWWLLSRGNARAVSRTAEERVQNARALLQAKAALIGYVAQKAAETTENNPGRLPCPEALGYIGGMNEGVASPNCTLPAIGRLPWRSLGLDKPRDAAGEPLWYVVSPGWALSNSTSPALTTYINSDTQGQLTLDTTTSVVALIIAPGRPLSIPASANCTARNQVRTTPSSTIDYRDYLECQNANSPADTGFTALGPSDGFNDQVVSITAAEVLPGIEGAIAKRIESQIIPSLRTVYNTAPATCAGGTGTQTNQWGVSFTCPAGTATNPVYPFAAPFGNPGTSNYQGAAATYAGLLPFNYSSGCNPATDARCTTTFPAWGTPSLSRTGGTGSLYDVPTCATDPSYAYCEGYYQNGSVTVLYDDRMGGAAGALRTFDSALHTVDIWAYNYNTGVWSAVTGTASRRFNSDASLSFRITATFPSVGAGNWGYYYVVGGRPAFSDIALLSEATATSGWFVRNRWYRNTYYAIAPNLAAGGTGSCVTGTSCLQVTGLSPSSNQRAILALAGRSLSGASRPNGNIADFLDSAENQNAGTVYEQLKVSRTFNDRFLVVDSNP